MERSLFRKYSALAQLGLWFLLFAVMFLDSAQYDTAYNGFLYASNVVLVNAFMVYVHYDLLLPFLIKDRRLLYAILVIPYVLFFSALQTITDSFLPYSYEQDVELESFLDMFSYTVPIAALLVAGSSLYYFVEQWFKNIRKEAGLRSEKLEAELNFLKSQINPHFLFNTLNNIYSYVQTGNEKSGPMLERLSAVLRFMVYDCSEEKVELAKEFEAVENLLEIYKMKNSDQENIRLQVQGVKSLHLVAPLIIVNLVENACKHSDAVSNPNGFINVKIDVDETDFCRCEISNSIKKMKNTAYGGVGMENVIHRLELQYGNDYQLEKEIRDNNYYLELGIPLERKQ